MPGICFREVFEAEHSPSTKIEGFVKTQTVLNINKKTRLTSCKQQIKNKKYESERY